MLIPALRGQAGTVDFVATAIPGIRGSGRICGARIETSYPFGPRLGCPVNLTAFGNRDRLDVGIALDPGRDHRTGGSARVPGRGLRNLGLALGRARVNVLVGTDGSRLSVRAAQRGIEILGRPDHVTLLTVLTEVPGDDAGGIEGSVYSPGEQERDWRAEVAEANAELARTAAALTGGTVDERIEVGEVARTICDVAREMEVDAIVVGSHIHGGLGRLFLGSVSEHVVRHAPCPVLVVRERNPDERSTARP